MRTIVFTYGTPRSGTTFLYWLMKSGEGYTAYKIPEYSINHPINSDTGLISLKKIFSGDHVVFVRMRRNPNEIFKSFHAARRIAADDLKEITPTMYPVMNGVAKNTDEHIFDMIRAERDNSRKQALKIITVNYDHLGEEEYRKRKVNEIAAQLPRKVKNYDKLLSYIQDNWKTKPIRGGRISYGVDVDLPKDLVMKIQMQL